MEPIKLFWTFSVPVGFQCLALGMLIWCGWSFFCSWRMRQAADRSIKSIDAGESQHGVSSRQSISRWIVVDTWVGLALLPIVVFLLGYGAWYEWSQADPEDKFRDLRSWGPSVLFGLLMTIYMGSSTYCALRDVVRERRRSDRA